MQLFVAVHCFLRVQPVDFGKCGLDFFYFNRSNEQSFFPRDSERNTSKITIGYFLIYTKIVSHLLIIDFFSGALQTYFFSDLSKQTTVFLQTKNKNWSASYIIKCAGF